MHSLTPLLTHYRYYAKLKLISIDGAVNMPPKKKNRVAILLIFIIPNSPFGTTFQHNATNSELPLRLPLMAPINNDES